VLTTTGWEPESLSRGVAVWTGNEVIVWGGSNSAAGGVYVPATDTWTPTSSTNAPSARYSHTAVWDGSHMIVWGGQTNTGTPFNTGGRYNPVLDSWQVTSTTGAPSGRSHHTAVWTGSEMVVWGGYRSDPFSHYNTGGRYDPLMNTWVPIAETGAPTPRREHVAVWTGSEMLVWGGWNGATEYSSGGRYTPDTDSWQPTSTADTPLGRHALSAAWTGTELLVWGGEYWNGSTFSYLNSGSRYNPASNAWAEHAFTTSGAPLGRYNHTGVWTGVHFLVWGGRNNAEDLNSGGLYNPETDNWSTTTTVGAPTPRMYHTAVWTGNEMVVWGGSTGSIDEKFGVYYPYGYYAIGGTLAELEPGETIVMQNNGADDLTVNSNGSFSFSEPLIDHSSYDVRVVTQPATSGRYCSVRNGSGTVSGADVTDIEVECFTLTLENVITALQVLSGMAPVGADLDTLKTLSENKKVELSVPILILRELATP
jgi:N-acetylneuraminic acid mutarotase